MNVILYLLFSKINVCSFSSKSECGLLYLSRCQIKLFMRKYGLCGRKIYDILAEYFLTLQYGIRTL